MAKLGSQKRPLILRVATDEAAMAAVAICEEHGWHYILGMEPDKPEDLRDLGRALRAAGSDEAGTMVPFAERFPELAARETRTAMILRGDRKLPAGDYAFAEAYCTDPSCDCRRVLIAVLSSARRRQVATINHAFDPPGDDDPEVDQTSLDPLNPQSDLSPALLDVFENVCLSDEAYRRRLEHHYELMKGAAGVRRIVAPGVAAPYVATKKQQKQARQKELRARRDERAFLFDPEVTRVLGEVDRARWERAIAQAGGAVARAAEACGLSGVPAGAKALWGRSEEEAMATYRRWRKRAR